MSKRLKILTWHVHGSYLYYLSHLGHDLYVPVKPGRPEGYGGRNGPFPWPAQLHEIPADTVRNEAFDCILFQSKKNYLVDQYEILSPAQQQLPRLYLEHDPPREHPTDTKHVVDDSNILLIHCTHFNQLMWDSGRTPTRVIEHGVVVPERIRYDGSLERGIMVVNGIAARGRRLGLDIALEAMRALPIDLVGMGTKEVKGLGEVPWHSLAEFESRYRFFFNPIRYTSLGLAVCEAMMIGMPIVGLATTEMVNVVENDFSGFVHTDVNKVFSRMRELLRDPEEARRLGEGARATARARFSLARFVSDWHVAIALVCGNRTSPPLENAQWGRL